MGKEWGKKRAEYWDLSILLRSSLRRKRGVSVRAKYRLC